eukprot:14219848-Ditylum_brightwellii.AAC.1
MKSPDTVTKVVKKTTNKKAAAITLSKPYQKKNPTKKKPSICIERQQLAEQREEANQLYHI